MSLDKIDIKIIQELQENARKSFAEIGRIVGLSSPAVADRMQKMEEMGVIEGYQVSLNPEKVGLHVQAYVTLKITSSNYIHFMSKLDQFPEVLECSKLTGEYCVSLKVAVRSNKKLEEVLNKLTEFGHPNTSIILSTITQMIPIREYGHL